MAETYPWYQATEGDGLEQGDVLQQFPVIVPPADLSFPIIESAIRAKLRVFDLIVITQSCDLANDKVSDVILCPHWDLTDRGTLDPALARVEAQKSILNGYRPRYAMLAASDVENLPLGIRIVDFGQVFSLPKPFVKQFALHQGRRLRLNPPYREHLSQSFARFFMRVGLPQNIELPK